MKNLRLAVSIALLLVISGCGLFSDSPNNQGTDPDQIATGVAATLTAIAEESPAATDMPPSPENTRPAWLDDPERIGGEKLPAELYGLTYRKVAVWLVDEEGLIHGAMGQPFEGAISPDGTGYLMSTDRPDGGDILYYNITNGETSRWTDTPDFSESNYHWWPERRNVIVYNFVPNAEGGPWYGYLAAKDITTGETIIIDDEFGSGTTFALSPDGERIAYLRDRQPAIYTWGYGSELIDMAAFGLDYETYATPAWSPDGEKLAFHAVGGLSDGGTEWAVVVLDLAAGTSQVIDEYISLGQRVGPELAFSPDGAWLASVNPGEITEDGQPVSMWVYSLTGGEDTNLGFAGPFYWHPESEYLLYQKWPGVGISDPHQIILAEVGTWTQNVIPELEGAFVFDWLDLP